MIGFTAQRLMELEVERKTGATYGTKSAERLVQRNGYRDRLWETRTGTVELLPQTAERQLLPGFPGAAPACRKGARRRGAGSLRTRGNAGERTHRIGRRHCGGWRQQRWPPRSAGHVDWAFRGKDLLDRVFAPAGFVVKAKSRGLSGS